MCNAGTVLFNADICMQYLLDAMIALAEEADERRDADAVSTGPITSNADTVMLQHEAQIYGEDYNNDKNCC